MCVHCMSLASSTDDTLHVYNGKWKPFSSMPDLVTTMHLSGVIVYVIYYSAEQLQYTVNALLQIKKINHKIKDYLLNNIAHNYVDIYAYLHSPSRRE